MCRESDTYHVLLIAVPMIVRCGKSYGQHILLFNLARPHSPEHACTFVVVFRSCDLRINRLKADILVVFTLVSSRFLDPKESNMSLSTAISHTNAQASVYSPLDLSQRSIRLLRILSDLNRQGYIQCKVRHATVESNYVCLSYVWGPPDEGHPVQLNDEFHLVRKNLYTFLRYARKKSFDWL